MFLFSPRSFPDHSKNHQITKQIVLPFPSSFGKVIILYPRPPGIHQ
ncbi:hypothetical protein GMO_23180 [Gluconobacter morbifer G707]|uniref:Uncharacterized protein n=1 Tax=Gluconobacter morbifer G707 TaxID=1088869 RepID=G6XLR9_9PROT|nr:hypothetical protein GMO_23180 [Gluconobacter morbifer G707]